MIKVELSHLADPTRLSSYRTCCLFHFGLDTLLYSSYVRELLYNLKFIGLSFP